MGVTIHGNRDIRENLSVGFAANSPTFSDARLQIKSVGTGDAASTKSIYVTDTSNNTLLGLYDSGNLVIPNGGVYVGYPTLEASLGVSTTTDFLVYSRASAGTTVQIMSDASGSDRVTHSIKRTGETLFYNETGLSNAFRISARDALNANRNKFSIWADFGSSTEPKWRIGDFLQLSSVDGAIAKVQSLSKSLNLIHADTYAITIETGTSANGAMSLKSAGTLATPADAAKIGVTDASSSLLLIGHMGSGGNSTINYGALLQRTHFTNAYDVKIISPATGTTGGVTITADSQIFRVTDSAGTSNLFSVTQDGRVFLSAFSKTSLPSATSNGVIIVTDEVGGRTIATSDGTNWRRVSDGAIVS